jgi:hypothetical protein
MKCVYFVADGQTARDNLVIGNYYLLTGGEVKFVTKEKELQITFDKNSDIVLQHGVYFPPQPNKFKRIDSILDEEHLSIINVIGAVRRVKTREQYKNKTKYTATLSDPLTHIEIDFMLFLNNGEKEIDVGMVIVLHNFQVFKQQNIFRLNSTFKSYYFEEKAPPNSNDLIGQFTSIIALTDWENDNYRNISMFAFLQRTIKDLIEILQRTDDERIYSSLEYTFLYSVFGF